MKTIKINKKEYPIKFTMNELRDAYDSGLNLETGEITAIYQLSLLGINNALKKQGSDEQLTMDDLENIIDEDDNAFKVLFDFIQPRLGKLTAVFGKVAVKK